MKSLFLAAFVIAGCASSGARTDAPQPAASAVEIPSAPADSASSAASADEPPRKPRPERSTPVASNNEPIGIPDCDRYLAELDTCMQKAPPASRDTMIQARNAARDAFVSASKTPGGRSAVEGACKSAADALAASSSCK